MSIWGKYKHFVTNKCFSSGEGNEGDLSFWRSKLFMNIMLFGVPIGCLVVLPSIIMSIINNLFIVAFYDTVALLIILFILFSNKLSLLLRKILLLANIYLLAIILLIFMGSKGPGLIFLLGASIFTSLIINSKAGYISVAINFVIYCLFAIGISLQIFDSQFFEDYPSSSSWIIIGINLLMVNAVVVISISILVGGLHKTLIKGEILQKHLIKDGKELIKAKTRAEQSDKLKSAILENISHEIRTPMNAIIGFSNLLEDAESEEKRNEFVNIINSNGDHLLRIVDDLIDISIIEAGILDIDNELFDVNELLDNILNAYGNNNKVLNYQIQLIVNKFKPYEKCNILSDEIRVEQIINNLLDNAFKFTHKGKIEFGYQIIKENDGSDIIRFYVSDTGMGIPKEMHERIFDRFRQIDDSTKRVIDGTGIGLSISKSIIKLMNGKIWVESEPGKGSTFYFTLKL